MRRDPSLTLIPFYLVDAVCEVPYGSYPGNMPYEYYSDEEHLREWLTVEKDPEALKKFIDKNIYNVKEFTEYIEMNGGLKKMQELRDKEYLINNSTAKK
jgi:glutaconate CoA-transferase subunit A